MEVLNIFQDYATFSNTNSPYKASIDLRGEHMTHNSNVLQCPTLPRIGQTTTTTTEHNSAHATRGHSNYFGHCIVRNKICYSLLKPVVITYNIPHVRTGFMFEPFTRTYTSYILIQACPSYTGTRSRCEFICAHHGRTAR